jgi:hypothetical protein
LRVFSQEEPATEEKKDDFSVGPLSVLMQSVKNNTQVLFFVLTDDLFET